MPGFDGKYCASDDGRVWSNTLNRELKQSVAGKGYLRIGVPLTTGRTTSAYVHRLVALAFHGLPPEGHEVRHLDGNPSNNSADNLAWGTHVQNMADQLRHGTRLRTHCVNGHEYTEENTWWNRSRKRNQFRVCRTCAIEWGKQRRRKRAEA